VAEENNSTIHLLFPGIRHLIPGDRSEVEFAEGETIGAFANRLPNRRFRLDAIERFYVNHQPVTKGYILQPGDILSGSPKVRCG